MRFAIVLALAACGTSAAPRTTPLAHPATLADLGWLVGAWHADSFDERFAMVSGTLWGVALNSSGFEINELRERGGRVELFTTDGTEALTLPLVSAAPDRVELGASERVGFRREGDQLHGDYARGDSIGQTFAATRVLGTHAAELEAADRAFSADSARRGADAWGEVLAPGGALWREAGRLEGADAIRADVAATLAAGALTWEPRESGVRGDWGFTVGTYAFTPAGATAQAAIGSYCTIWRRVDGAWRVAFDVGS